MAGRLVKAGASMLAATSGGGDPSQGGVCPTTTESLVRNHAKFHSDGVCNRKSYDLFKRNLGKHLTYQRFKASGEHNLVPNQKTLVCPAIVNDLTNPDAPTGYDTNWIVENTASRPVVLSYVKDGVEHSAMDATISPPENDPKAIMKPGEWKHVHAFEGHVFHARELNEDGTPGKVLLQHRAGLIPVGSKSRHLLSCPTDDPEPLVEVEEEGGEKTVIRDPAYKRTAERPIKECHLMDIGFRNLAGCPLHVYWQRPDTCEEVFKFHLGTNGYAEDFHWGWESPTKFESSKIGHTFVFRSPIDNLLVDTITLLPTQIVDCPDLKQKVAAPITGSRIALPVGRTLPAGNSNASNNTTLANATNNTTAASARPQRINNANGASFDSTFFGSLSGSSSF